MPGSISSSTTTTQPTSSTSAPTRTAPAAPGGGSSVDAPQVVFHTPASSDARSGPLLPLKPPTPQLDKQAFKAFYKDWRKVPVQDRAKTLADFLERVQESSCDSRDVITLLSDVIACIDSRGPLVGVAPGGAFPEEWIAITLNCAELSSRFCLVPHLSKLGEVAVRGCENGSTEFATTGLFVLGKLNKLEDKTPAINLAGLLARACIDAACDPLNQQKDFRTKEAAFDIAAGLQERFPIIKGSIDWRRVFETCFAADPSPNPSDLPLRHAVGVKALGAHLEQNPNYRLTHDDCRALARARDVSGVMVDPVRFGLQTLLNDLERELLTGEWHGPHMDQAMSLMYMAAGTPIFERAVQLAEDAASRAHTFGFLRGKTSAFWSEPNFHDEHIAHDIREATLMIAQKLPGLMTDSDVRDREWLEKNWLKQYQNAAGRSWGERDREARQVLRNTLSHYPPGVSTLILDYMDYLKMDWRQIRAILLPPRNSSSSSNSGSSSSSSSNSSSSSAGDSPLSTFLPTPGQSG